MIKLILLFFCLIGCSFSEPKYCKLSDRLFIPYNRELKSKGLYLIGSGGAMMDDIQKVNATYISYQQLNVEQARELYVDVMEGYISRYNQNAEIRPYLHTYPVTVENFSVMIGFENEKHSHMGNGFVALMLIGKNNKLFYRAYDPQTDKFIPLNEEPYEVARQIVIKDN
jgi:hypothetical protein